MHTTSDKFSFIGAALSLIVTYVTAAVPIPLYGLYQTQDQIGYLALSISSVVYFVGAVTALLLFGRLTNYLGRKPVSLAALLLAALSVLFFVNLHHAPQLTPGACCRDWPAGSPPRRWPHGSSITLRRFLAGSLRP